MRKKKLDYDGQEYVISPLTLEQVDEFIADIPINVEVTDTLERIKALQGRAQRVVAWGLDNALDKNAADRWTPDRVYKEIDLPTFGKLQQEILIMSGMDPAREAAGEAKAAPTIQ